MKRLHKIVIERLVNTEKLINNGNGSFSSFKKIGGSDNDIFRIILRLYYFVEFRAIDKTDNYFNIDNLTVNCYYPDSYFDAPITNIVYMNFPDTIGYANVYYTEGNRKEEIEFLYPKI